METSINGLAQALKNAERVAVLTGAGVSAESGIPTFRGAEGLWKNHPAASLALTAKSRGAMLAEINLERTPNSNLMDRVMTGKAGKILPVLAEGLS